MMGELYGVVRKWWEAIDQIKGEQVVWLMRSEAMSWCQAVQAALYRCLLIYCISFKKERQLQ